MNNNIKTYIIEEHHEAFIIWNHAIINGIISPEGNCLFHVDEHSDMDIGYRQFNNSINNLNSDIKEIVNFTYEDLKINSFIIPSVYRGIFNQVYWIRQVHVKNKIRPIKLYVRSYNQAGYKLVSGKCKNLTSNFNDVDRKEFDYYLITDDRLPFKRKVVLDIDLDYFSCIDFPIEDIKIEITEDEYNLFRSDKYHRLNYITNTKIEPYSENGKYYYVINQFKEKYPSRHYVNEDEITKRINKFINVLKEKNIKPSLIDICRSKHSGYTPSDQVEFIQEQLLKSLSNLYNIEIRDLKELV